MDRIGPEHWALGRTTSNKTLAPTAQARGRTTTTLRLLSKKPLSCAHQRRMQHVFTDAPNPSGQVGQLLSHQLGGVLAIGVDQRVSKHTLTPEDVAQHQLLRHRLGESVQGREKLVRALNRIICHELGLLLPCDQDAFDLTAQLGV